MLMSPYSRLWLGQSGVPVESIREETTSAESRSSDAVPELKSITSRSVKVDARRSVTTCEKVGLMGDVEWMGYRRIADGSEKTSGRSRRDSRIANPETCVGLI